MENYLLFVVVATVTILSPGPGVILTLSNAIRHGLSGSVGGIVGIAIGTFIVAGISATGLGLLLATSSLAFSILKFVGAAYLLYLGIKLWRSPTVRVSTGHGDKKAVRKQFFEGLALQLTNPKAVFFFLSVFPQFIDFTASSMSQFTVLVVTYSTLVIAIHLVYAYLATSARGWLSSEKGGRLVNRLGGATFVCFGVGLAAADS